MKTETTVAGVAVLLGAGLLAWQLLTVDPADPTHVGPPVGSRWRRASVADHTAADVADATAYQQSVDTVNVVG